MNNKNWVVLATALLIPFSSMAAEKIYIYQVAQFNNVDDKANQVNEKYEFGSVTPDPDPNPVPDNNNMKFSQAYGGFDSGFFVDQSGDVWATGFNTYGSLGVNIGGDQNTIQKTNLSNITKMAITATSVLALDSSNQLWVAGRNQFGQLGTGNYISLWEFVQTKSGVVDIAAGWENSYHIDTNGDVWAAGNNDYGQLGQGNYITYSTWVKTNMTNAISIGAGMYSGYAVKSDGVLYGVGRNNKKQLGFADTANRDEFEATPLSNVKQIIAGSDTEAYAIDTSNNVWVVGENSSGKLMTGNVTDVPVWTMNGDSNLTQLVNGRNHAYMIKDGTLYSGGENGLSALGTGDTTDHYSWYNTGLDDVVFVGAGIHAGYAITSDGTLYGVGSDSHGALSIRDSASNMNVLTELNTEDPATYVPPEPEI